MTKKTRITPLRILEYGQSLCVLSIQPYQKVGTNFYDAQKKGEKKKAEY